MQPRVYLTFLAASMAIAMASPLNAAEKVPLQTEFFKNLQQQFQLSLPGVVNAAIYSPHTLQFLQYGIDKNRIKHIRMQQQYAGFDVYGGYVILHSKQAIKNLLVNQADVQVNGVVYHGLQNELGQPSADFNENAPLALKQFKTQFRGQAQSEEEVQPIVYIDEDQKAHWAYRVSVLIENKNKIPERPTAIIDAQNYQPFLKWDDIKTNVLQAKAMGYGGNTKVGQYIFDGMTRPLLDITRDTSLQTCYMENAEMKVVDMMHQYNAPKNPMKFRCDKKIGTDNSIDIFWTGYEGDGYDRYNGAFSPSNDAMYAGYVIKHMYSDWYKVEVLTERGYQGRKTQPMQLIMRVHYGNHYENAYWDGKQMTFGDGDNLLYPLVSLEIGAHEISHGFTQQHSRLEYIAQSGGVNESFSDMAAKAAEFYSTQTNTWIIGAEIVKEGSSMEALRYMDNPSRDGQSIDTAAEYTKGLDVHFSSGVFNRLFYLMATTRGWNSQKAFEVMVQANMYYWIPTTSFTEAGCGVLNAASDLNYSLDDVRAALRAVAINPTACPAII